MSPNTPLMRSDVLPQSLLSKGLMVLAGTLFIAIAAQVSVPFFPVPLTLQTLAILIVGLTFGSRMGAVTLLTYLAEGAMGLPVFANGANTAALMGPTAGFLFGFVGVAYLAGLAVEKGLARGVVSTAIVGIVVSALLYVPGAAWPMGVAGAFGVEAGWVGTSAAKIWAGWVSPFLLGDAVKAVIAAMVVAGGRKALSR